MEFPELEQIRIWIWRFSVLVAVLVGLLSWHNGIGLFNLILRVAIAFLVIYALLAGGCELFSRYSPSPPEPPDANGLDGRGTVFDVTVGDDLDSLSFEQMAEGESISSEGDSASMDAAGNFIGAAREFMGVAEESIGAAAKSPSRIQKGTQQVNAQAWRPGQLDPSLSDGLTNDQKQAEIVRRMGWGS